MRGKTFLQNLFRPAALKPLVVTLPAVTELSAFDMAGSMSDFAVNNGARVQAYEPLAGGSVKYGELWTRTLSGRGFPQACYLADSKRQIFRSLETVGRRSQDERVGVAPYFQNAVTAGIGTVTTAYGEYLTVGGEMAVYPQNRVDSTTGNYLETQYQQGALTVAAHLMQPSTLTETGELKMRAVPVYRVGPLSYARVANERDKNWYHCDQILAHQTRGGNVQVESILFAAPLDARNTPPARANHREIDPQQCALGKFLHQTFLEDIKRLAGLQAKEQLPERPRF